MNNKTVMKNYRELKNSNLGSLLAPGFIVFLLCLINPVIGGLSGLIWFVLIEVEKTRLFLIAKSGISVKDMEEKK